MVDENSRSAPVVQSNGAAGFSLQSPRLDEIEDLCNRFVAPHRLTTVSRIQQEADSKLSVHGVKDLGIFTVAYGAELTAQVYPTDVDDRLAFIIAESGAGHAKMEGQEHAFTAEQGAIIPSGPELFMHYQDNCETLSILLSRSRLAEQCAKLLGREIERPLEFNIQTSLRGAAGQSWRRLGSYVAGELSDPLSMTLQVPAVAKQLEQMVSTAFLLGHSHTYSDALLRPQSAAVPFYVKRAEAFIEAHFSEPLSLADIAAQAGVSARSLQNGFQNFRNTTPMGFLRSLRLKRAYEMLLLSDPSTVTVTEIALRCGFGHLGEFATAYRHAFGEAPRQTLARARAG
jgi:AraC-like DNA-binding protein